MNKGTFMLSPSLMCADFESLGSVVRELETAGANAFHIDIMDGRYVPNFGMGVQDIATIRKNTNQTLDVHLMIQDPGNYVSLFASLGADIIYFHPDTCSQPYQVLTEIKAHNVKCGIAISPGVSISEVEPLLEAADYVLLMTVNPGFSGQPYIDAMNRKFQSLNTLKKTHCFKVIADGALTYDRIQTLKELGVDGFVLGTSVLFKKEYTVDEYTKVFEELSR